MKKADLHVHSKYSGTSSLFFLQKKQVNESYTEPEYIYHMAKKMGMDYVTITDHDSIEGIQKLILLFDNFETINGCRSLASNRIWKNTVDQLDGTEMERLALKHTLLLLATYSPFLKGIVYPSNLSFQKTHKHGWIEKKIQRICVAKSRLETCIA